MTWSIGQKIVCVRKGTLEFSVPPPSWAGQPTSYLWPEPSKVYTIRYIWQSSDADGLSFWLEEIADDLVAYHEELFRPLESVEQKELVSANADR